jgi:hypothetical protein
LIIITKGKEQMLKKLYEVIRKIRITMIIKIQTVEAMKAKFFIVKICITPKINLIKRSNILKICKLKPHKILRNEIISFKIVKAEEIMIL